MDLEAELSVKSVGVFGEAAAWEGLSSLKICTVSVSDEQASIVFETLKEMEYILAG